MVRNFFLIFFLCFASFAQASKDYINNSKLVFELKFKFEKEEIIASISRQNSRTEVVIKNNVGTDTIREKFFFNGVVVGSINDAQNRYPCISFYDGLNLVAILAYNKKAYWIKNIQENNFNRINAWEMNISSETFYIRLYSKGDSLQIFASSYLMKERKVVLKSVTKPIVSILNMQIVSLRIRSDNDEEYFIKLSYSGNLLVNSANKKKTY